MSKYSNLLNEQVKEALESYIIEHGLTAGDALPSERVLAENLGVNRLTVRAAIKRLRNEHRINTLHGKGNFIAPPKIMESTSKMESFTAGWSNDGYTPTSKLLAMDEREAPLSICYQLGISLGDKVIFLNRVRYLNGEPVALENTYLPSKLVPGILCHNFEKESLYAVLESEYNLRLMRQEETISICHMSKAQSRHLNAKEGDPAFLINGLSFDGDSPFEYCTTINPADRYALSSTMTPDTKSNQ